MNRGDHRSHRHADINQYGFGQLKAGLDCLGYCVRSANAVEMRRMRGITSARDDQQVLPLSSRRSHQLISSGRVVERYHQGARGLQVQTLQQVELRYITEIDSRALFPLARHSVGIAVDRNIRHLVHFQHCRDGLADAAEPCDDHPG